MTGDRWDVARKVGRELGCDDVAAATAVACYVTARR